MCYPGLPTDIKCQLLRSLFVPILVIVVYHERNYYSRGAFISKYKHECVSRQINLSKNEEVRKVWNLLNWNDCIHGLKEMFFLIINPFLYQDSRFYANTIWIEIRLLGPEHSGLIFEFREISLQGYINGYFLCFPLFFMRFSLENTEHSILSLLLGSFKCVILWFIIFILILFMFMVSMYCYFMYLLFANYWWL